TSVQYSEPTIWSLCLESTPVFSIFVIYSFIVILLMIRPTPSSTLFPYTTLFRSIAINGHIKFNLTIPLQQLNGLETLVIIMVANKYAFLQITRRRFLNEWEAFKKVISRRNIRRRITIPLTLSNLKLL